MLVNRTACRSTMEDCFATKVMTGFKVQIETVAETVPSSLIVVRPMNLRWVSYIYATHEGHSGMQHSYDW
jgi:hypothetical protein